MDLTRQNKLIDKIAKGLTNGSIKQSDISSILEKEFGTLNVNSSTYIRPTEIERKKQIEDQKVRFENRELYRSFIELWKCLDEIKKNPEPFTIKFQSLQFLHHLENIRSFRENENYSKTLLEAIK